MDRSSVVPDRPHPTMKNGVSGSGSRVTTITVPQTTDADAVVDLAVINPSLVSWWSLCRLSFSSASSLSFD